MVVWNSAILYELCITSINGQKTQRQQLKRCLLALPSKMITLNMVEMTNPEFLMI
jgi:hypothetical protein